MGGFRDSGVQVISLTRPTPTNHPGLTGRLETRASLPFRIKSGTPRISSRSRRKGRRVAQSAGIRSPAKWYKLYYYNSAGVGSRGPFWFNSRVLFVIRLKAALRLVACARLIPRKAPNYVVNIRIRWPQYTALPWHVTNANARSRLIPAVRNRSWVNK